VDNQNATYRRGNQAYFKVGREMTTRWRKGTCIEGKA